MGRIDIVGHGVRKLKPLSASLSFDVEGGGLVQAVNAVTREHIPDWRFTPIRIRPIITVADPEGLVTSGVHNSDTPTANMRWLYDETGINVLQGVSPADMSMDTSATDLRGSLNIRKNFDHGALLRFEFEYSTSSGGVLRTVKHSGTIAIVVNQMADALVQVRTVYPRGQFVFFPQPAAPANLRMQMQLYYKGEACPAAYKWFKVVDGNEAAIGTFVNELGVTADSVATQPNYRCKALDMRPEYAAALEAAMTQARADVYKKYLGDDWEAVRPTVRPNRLRYSPIAGDNQYYTVSPITMGVMKGVNLKRKTANSAPFDFVRTEGLIQAGRSYILSYFRGQEYLQQQNPTEGNYTYIGPGGIEGEENSTTDGGTRVCISFKAKRDANSVNLYGHITPTTDTVLPAGVNYWGFKLEEAGGLDALTPTPYLPHIDELNAEIRARAAEIVAANPPTPPSVWPLERTYIRDFTLSIQTIPYELLLRIEGLGEVVIVRSGSLARGAGPAQELFSNVPRGMTKFRASIVCRQGRHTYTPEQTASMFDVTWPSGSEQVNGCRAIMTSLSFNLSITPRY